MKSTDPPSTTTLDGMEDTAQPVAGTVTSTGAAVSVPATAQPVAEEG